MDLFRKVVETEPTKANFTTAIVGVITITENYLQLNEFQKAFDWTLKFMELLDYYKELPNPDPASSTNSRPVWISIMPAPLKVLAITPKLNRSSIML